jgi:DNA-binding MarR family transcriptional regulator
MTPRLDDQLCFALYAASRAVISAYQPVLAALEITYPQYLVLMVLWEEGECRVTRLGERLELDSGTLSPLLKRLEARGLVERRRRSDDERVVEVRLTTEGKRLEKQAISIQQQAFCNAKMSVADVRALRDSLKQLTRNLTKGKM